MNTKEAAATVTLKNLVSLLFFFFLFAFVFLAVFVLGWLLF